MFKAFNMGIGMVLVVDKKDARAAEKLSKGIVIGQIKPGSGQVEII